MMTLRRISVSVTLALLGCGSSEPSVPASPLLGHFAAPIPFPFTGLYLGLSITSVSPAVVGIGWMPGLETPFSSLAVTGTLSGDNVSLTLTSGGAPFGTLTGTVTSTRFQGVLSRGVGLTPIPVSFTRVDTLATGRHSTTLSGSAAEQLTSLASFAVLPTNTFYLALEYPGRNYPVLAMSRPGGRPGPGTYALSPDFTATVVPAYAPDQRFFSMTSGTLRIDVSTPLALIGQVTMQTREAASGATLTAVSSFSAVCIIPTC